MVLRVLQTGGGEACTNQCGWMRETERCGWVRKAKRSSGLAERRLGRSERRLGRAGEAAELCGVAELLGAQGKAEQRLGGAEAWWGRGGGGAEAWRSGGGGGAFGCSPYNNILGRPRALISNFPLRSCSTASFRVVLLAMEIMSSTQMSKMSNSSP